MECRSGRGGRQLRTAADQAWLGANLRRRQGHVGAKAQGRYNFWLMRRWLIIFMLTLLPLQLSWAEAASYCAHETGVAAQHFGHHEHRHSAGDTAAANAADNGVPGTQAAADLDCGACHAGCAIAIVGSVITTPHSAPPTFVAPAALRLSAPPLSLPDRPNWARLA